MTSSITELKTKFNDIKSKGYIKSINNNRNSSGLTLEKCLESTGGDICIPDFKDIEIKCISIYSTSNLNLFSSSPDGKYILPTQWLSENYGYPDSKYKDIKILQCKLDTTLSKIGNYYYFAITIDKEKKKIFLNVYDINKKFINNYIYWDFDSIEEKLLRKLSLMAIIKSKKKENTGNIYYSYIDMKLYKLKDFETFLNLIEKNIVKICIKTGIYRSGPKKGNFHDHGTSFEIAQNDISKLFDTIK